MQLVCNREVVYFNQIIDREFLLVDIVINTQDISRAIDFAAELGLIPNSAVCCSESMVLVNRTSVSDGKVWRCSVCRRRQSIRKNSFFTLSHISLPKLVQMMYWWAAVDCKQYVVMKQVGLGTETIVKNFIIFVPYMKTFI